VEIYLKFFQCKFDRKLIFRIFFCFSFPVTSRVTLQVIVRDMDEPAILVKKFHLKILAYSLRKKWKRFTLVLKVVYFTELKIFFYFRARTIRKCYFLSHKPKMH